MFPQRAHDEPARTQLSVPVLPNDIVWTLMGQVAFPPMPGIVLAAGRSLRMGRPKALLPWPATQVPFVLHVTETLRNAGIGPLGVVTGEHHDVIAATLEGLSLIHI